MKTLNLKVTVDAGEHAAIITLANNMKMDANQYLTYCMRIGHAKIVGDINQAMEMARAEKEAQQ